MVQKDKTRVYREDWGFRVTSTEELFARSKKFIKNDRYRMSDVYDYMDIEDFNICKEVDVAVYSLKYGLRELLADRVYFEYDINNHILRTFEEAIQEGWYKVGWENVIDIVKGVKEGKYDDEMKRYYAYIQAVETLKNIDLLDFSWEDESVVEGNLRTNGIIVYDDDIFFRVAGVIDSVERTFDLEMDVKRLLVMVIRTLKNTGETIDFVRGY